MQSFREFINDEYDISEAKSSDKKLLALQKDINRSFEDYRKKVIRDVDFLTKDPFQNGLDDRLESANQALLYFYAFSFIKGWVDYSVTSGGTYDSLVSSLSDKVPDLNKNLKPTVVICLRFNNIKI